MLEREALPIGVEVARWVVEREQRDDRDRDQHVGGGQEGIDGQCAPAQPSDERRRRRRVWRRVGGLTLAGVIVADDRRRAESPEVGDDRDHDQRHQGERERRRGRIVGQVQELPLDDVADHGLVRAAEEVGIDVVADSRDERQQHAGEDPRERARQRDPAERLARGRVEVLRRLDEPAVEPFEIGVDRQQHERQEVVSQPRDDRS